MKVFPNKAVVNGEESHQMDAQIIELNLMSDIQCSKYDA
jgi:hypothetical protein